ncbi:MAG: NAD(P)-binding protein [Phycisphaerae bacterium]|nr:NAD(P)-binding protein [Phycisphaerae bacterium]
MRDPGSDVLVVGAGVAGGACAAMLAQAGLRVALIEERPIGVATDPTPEWVTPATLECLRTAEVDLSSVLGPPLSGVTFHSADLTQQIESLQADPPAYCVDYGALAAEVARQAAGLGAHVLTGCRATSVELSEDAVTVVTNKEGPLRGRFLVWATGAEASTNSNGAKAGCVVTVQRPLTAVSGDRSMHWVLGLPGERTLGCWWFDGSGLMMRLQGRGDKVGVCRELDELTERAASVRMIPCDVMGVRGKGVVRTVAAPLALEFDSHVGKNTLTIGEAGGFIASSSGDGIYPGVWSARLAVDTLLCAVGSRHTQDELQGFDTLWRSTMGEYLRPPDTDTPFLLPIIFSNRRMADRMAGALWRGENV